VVTVKIGRNDPCPCGSGKKYKRCCLAKDQEAERARRVATQLNKPPVVPSKPATSAPGFPSPPSTTEVDIATDDALNARYEAFEAADYEGKIALFYHTLDEEALMDAEMAFEMLS